MGLLYYDAKRLWEAHQSGVSFESVLTCSRQQLFLRPAELEQLCGEHRAKSKTRIEVPLADYRFGGYADQFFYDFLETKALETLDYSDYEGASVVHDMNLPVPESLFGRFEAVIEAGSLEHIFNFPVAIRNLMRMAKVGGQVFLTMPANNFCGHGFYQFSPELAYRIFAPENGFEPASVVFLDVEFFGAELTPIRGAYSVTDPVTVHSRVGLVSARPVLMMVAAKKIREVEPFVTPPQQSDYVAVWEETTGPESKPVESPRVADSAAKSLAKRIYRGLPITWQRSIEGHRMRAEYSFRNRNYYRKLS